MRRPSFVRFLSALLFAALLAGCGKDKPADREPDPLPTVAANASTPVGTEQPVGPKTEPDPKDPAGSGLGKIGPLTIPTIPMGPPSTNPLPQVPMPPLPPPKDPSAVPPPETTPQPPKTDPMTKKDPDKPLDWPTALNGRPMSEYVNDISSSDPAIREMGLRTVPNFGPPAREMATKAVLAHMDGSREADPGVRAAAFEAIGALALLGKDGGLDKEADTREAIRILYTAADQGARGGGTRLHAVQTLASFGPKAEGAIAYIIGQNMTSDPAYTIRQAIASTLGSIAYNEKTGPNPRALNCLTDVLIKDKSAAVRLAAFQSLVVLGPPLMPSPPLPPGALDKPKPVVDAKATAVHTRAIKLCLAPYKAEPGTKDRDSPTGLMERDKQVEIFARLALMRFDPVEINDDNLSGIAKYINAPGADTAPKLQALNALGMMGEASSRRINDVVAALDDPDPAVATAAVTTLVLMGKEAKDAIEFLEKLKKRGSLKDEKDPKDYPKEYWASLSERAIKAIKEAKPAKP